MTEAATQPVPAGHWWKEPDRVAEYITRWDREAEEIGKIFELLVSLAPFEKDAPIRVLDIGSGHGVLAAAVLGLVQAGIVGLALEVFAGRDVRPIARALLRRFGSFAGAISAPRPALRAVDGLAHPTLKGLLRRVLGKIFDDVSFEGFCREAEQERKAVEFHGGSERS